jgi:AraC-like DNA-binding protein
MHTTVYNIKNQALKPYIQYILFNSYTSDSYNSPLRSFANINFCLGIIQHAEIAAASNNHFKLEHKKGIHSYISGIYLEPFSLLPLPTIQEICIDFTPAGFYHFFKFPAKTFLKGNILEESFGKNANSFFEQVFDETSCDKKGAMIEEFLLTRIQGNNKPFIDILLYTVDSGTPGLTVKEIAKKMNCSTKSINRAFTTYFDILPKEYLRVKRFRRILTHLQNNSFKHAYYANINGFYDQSHLINEIKCFTNTTPSRLMQETKLVEGKVWFGIESPDEPTQ